MLPGVELARRRRVCYRGDAASSSSSSSAWEHHYHLLHASAHRAGAAAVAGPALAARARLEEKLRGAALPLPPASPSRSVFASASPAARPLMQKKKTSCSFVAKLAMVPADSDIARGFTELFQLDI